MQKKLAEKLITEGLNIPYEDGMQLKNVLEKQLEPNILAVQEAAKNKPEAQRMMENNTEESNIKSGPVVGYTQADTERRNTRILEFQTAGLTANTILKIINEAAITENRPPVKNNRSIIQIVSDHYRSLRPSQKEARDEIDALKEAALARQDQMIETLALYISNNKNILKPREYVQATAELFKMQQFNIENRNRNASRANPNINMHNTTVNIFQNNTTTVENRSPAIGQVLDILDAELG